MTETITETPISKPKWPWIVGGIALVVALFAASWVLTIGYVSRQTVERSFVVDVDFTRVRKIMVRTNASQQIITMGGTSEFVEQKWEGGSVQAEGNNVAEALLKSVFSQDPGWSLNLNGILKVRTLDDYVGHEVVTLRQKVVIDPNFIDSQSKLIEGSERLLDYGLTTRMEREEDHTLITLTLTQAIKTHAPWFAHGIADRRVRESASRSLEKQEGAMIKLINDNKDKDWLLPLN